MPAIITATQLRNVLGVSSALYDDSYLNQIIDSAEGIILPMLVANVSGVSHIKRLDDVAYYYTVRPHGFVPGNSVIVTNVPSPFAATVTVTEDQFTDPYLFTAASVGADIDLKPVIPNGTATLSGYSAADLYANTPAVESAVYVVSTEIFQSRLSIGGQLEGVDFTPTPFRLGRSLLSRVSALLAPYIDTETMAQ
jgi:hypothetical protein